MKRQTKGRKLSRGYDQRQALLKSLARSLFLHEKIKTTEAKAKEISIVCQKMITKAKDGDLSARRYLRQYFGEDLVKKLVDDIAVRYKERHGGYVRIIKLGPRKSDSAKMAIIELVK